MGIKVPAQPPASLKPEADKQMETGPRKTDSSASQARATARGEFDHDVAPRGEQRRPLPSVFLGGAGSDSSWRFVIVVGVLFLLFLLLFVLSKWLR
jgi:hypothetical protein